MATEVELVLGLLVAMTALVGVAQRLNLPAPIVLVAGGIVIGLLPGMPAVSLDPDLVLMVFLPPLLFDAAYNMSLREMRRYAAPIGSLSIGLVLGTAAVVGWLTHLMIPGFSWLVAFTLGAIIAPTDAVAASSIVSQVGAPRRLGVILNGESLVNDATALTAYRIAVVLVVSGVPFSFLDASWRFFLAGAGGIVVGSVLALAILSLYRVMADVRISITISFLATFVAYLIADEIQASGVIAVVVLGLIISRWDDKFSVRIRIEAGAIWQQVTALVTSFVFVLIGLQLPEILSGISDRSVRELIVYAAMVNLAVFSVRMLWSVLASRIFGPLHPPKFTPLSWGESVIVGWAGMRGVISLAAALALPLLMDNGDAFPERHMVIFLTFSVIVTTLIVQGLTLPSLIRWLGVTEMEDQDQIRAKAKYVAVRAALERLDKLEEENWSGEELDDVRRHYEDQLHLVTDQLHGQESSELAQRGEQISRLKREVIEAESLALAQLRDSERISDDVVRDVRRAIDYERLRYEPDQ